MSRVLDSKSKGKPIQSKLENVPVKTVVKVVTEKKSAAAKVEINTKLAESSTVLKSGKSSAILSKTTTPELKSSQSSSNLTKETQIKKILATGKPADKVVKDIMKVTEVDSNVNIDNVDNDKKIRTLVRKVTFKETKDELETKSVQLKGKPAANAKPTTPATPAVSNAKGGKSTSVAKTNAADSKPPGVLKKGVSTSNLASNSTILPASKALSKSSSTKSFEKSNEKDSAKASTINNSAGKKEEPKKVELGPFMIEGLIINIDPKIQSSMDYSLIKILLEAKGLIIQKNYIRHFYRKKVKENKIISFIQLIKFDTFRKIFPVLRKINYIFKNKDNITRLDLVVKNALENIKKSIFIESLKFRYDYIQSMVRIQGRFRKYSIYKLRKNRATKLSHICNLKEFKILRNNFILMKTISENLKKRDNKLINIFNVIDSKIDQTILRNNLKKLQYKNRKIKATTRFESIFLYKLINNYSNHQDPYFTINTVIIRDEEEAGYIDHLKKDTFGVISNFVKAKIKNYLLTQFMQHSLEGGVFLTSKRIKLIFDTFCYNITADRYFLDFDENKELSEQFELNIHNKIKFRTKNYFLLNIFKIQKTFLEYHYSHKKRQNETVLTRIILNQDKKTLKNYFNKFKNYVSADLYQTEEVFEKAYNILHRSQEIELDLNEKEKKLKEMIMKSEQKIYSYAVDCYDHWKRLNAVHFCVIKIQAAWRDFMQKPSVNYLDMQDNYASWSIHLKKMRRMEEIFNSIFKRTHRNAFNSFIINLASYSSCFGKPNSPFRKSHIFDKSETVDQANLAFRQAKENYSKYVLLTIVNNRQTKDSLILQNALNVMRRNAKLRKLVSSVIKIQRVFRDVKCDLKLIRISKNKEYLANMFRKTFASRLIRMLKIIKLTFYEFFMAKDYESNQSNLSVFNPVTDLVNNIKLVFAKIVIKSLLRHDRLYNKLRFIQLYWKAKMKLIKNKRIKEILKTFALSKIRNNKRIFHNAFDKWLNNSLLLTINVAAEILTKFLYSNYILKARFKKFLRRIIIKKIMRELIECFY